MIDAEAEWVTSETPVTGLEATIGSNLLFFLKGNSTYLSRY